MESPYLLDDLLWKEALRCIGVGAKPADFDQQSVVGD